SLVVRKEGTHRGNGRERAADAGRERAHATRGAGWRGIGVGAGVVGRAVREAKSSGEGARRLVSDVPGSLPVLPATSPSLGGPPRFRRDDARAGLGEATLVATATTREPDERRDHGE